MGKCPECNGEINYLRFRQDISDLHFTTKYGSPEYDSYDSTEYYGKFYCPECLEELTSDEDEAIEILEPYEEE